MSYCPVCSAELRLMNTPILGASRLADGEKLCTPCYDRLLTMVDAQQVHQLTSREVNQMFADDDAFVERIITQIVDAGFDRGSITANWASSELQYLPDIIGGDENIVAFASGIYLGAGGILVATYARLFFLTKPPLEELQITEFEWDYVEAITPDVMPNFSALLITYNGDVHAIEEVATNDADRFCSNVSANIPGFGPDATDVQEDTSSTQPLPQADVPAQLEKYADLKNKGVITQAEFDAMKKKLLGL